MTCRCEARLKECNHQNKLCPASTYRLLYDYPAAIEELHNFTEQDRKEKTR